MNSKQKTLSKILSVSILITILLAVFGIDSATAQKAPEFSNDLMMDNRTTVFFMVDRLEYNVNKGLNPLAWEARGSVGKDLSKFWFETEGKALTVETQGEAELEALYGRAISPYFDARAGLRYDIAHTADDTQTRGFAVIGIQGLAPYLFEVDGSIAVSEVGDISASFEAEYDLPLTQRLWAQPRVGTSIAVQEVPEWGVGNGFNNIQLGFRLRYEIEREFAPYIGVSWNRKLGETANFTRAGGRSASVVGMVGGVRMWL